MRYHRMIVLLCTEKIGIVMTWCCLVVHLKNGHDDMWWLVFKKSLHVIESVGGLISASFLYFYSHNDTDYEWCWAVIQSWNNSLIYVDTSFITVISLNEKLDKLILQSFLH